MNTYLRFNILKTSKIQDSLNSFPCFHACCSWCWPKIYLNKQAEKIFKKETISFNRMKDIQKVDSFAGPSKTRTRNGCHPPNICVLHVGGQPASLSLLVFLPLWCCLGAGGARGETPWSKIRGELLMQRKEN